MAVEMVKTGIAGFDELYGGVPKGHTILLTGPVGSHAPLFGLEFLYRGAVNKERCIYASFERKEEDLVGMASVFDWDLAGAIKGKNLLVMSTELFNYEQFLSSLEDTVFSHKATRVVFDSISYLGEFFETPFKFRAGIGELKRMLGKHECTTLLLSEAKGEELSPHNMGEFIADGVIRLHFTEQKGQALNAISVPEMGGAEVSSQLYPVELTKSGLRIRHTPFIDRL